MYLRAPSAGSHKPPGALTSVLVSTRPSKCPVSGIKTSHFMFMFSVSKRPRESRWVAPSEIFQTAHLRASFHGHAEIQTNCTGDVSPFCEFGVCVSFGLGPGQGGFEDTAASIPDEVLAVELMVLFLNVVLYILKREAFTIRFIAVFCEVSRVLPWQWCSSLGSRFPFQFAGWALSRGPHLRKHARAHGARVARR